MDLSGNRLRAGDVVSMVMDDWTRRGGTALFGLWSGRLVAALAALLVPASLLSNPSLQTAPAGNLAVGAESLLATEPQALGVPPSPLPALCLPVAGVAREALRDSFGDARSGGRCHRAIYIPAPRDTPVLAAVDGTIAALGSNQRGGLIIHQFDSERRLAYYYAHLERYASGLVEGMTVRRGDVIAYVGTSGNAPPTAPHLHFAVYELRDRRWLGQPINPYPLLAATP